MNGTMQWINWTQFDGMQQVPFGRARKARKLFAFVKYITNKTTKGDQTLKMGIKPQCWSHLLRKVWSRTMKVIQPETQDNTGMFSKMGVVGTMSWRMSRLVWHGCSKNWQPRRRHASAVSKALYWLHFSRHEVIFPEVKVIRMSLRSRKLREILLEFWVKFGDIQRYQRIPFKIPVNQGVKEVSQSYLTTMNNKSSRLLTSAVTERSAAVEHQYFRAPNGLGPCPDFSIHWRCQHFSPQTSSNLLHDRLSPWILVFKSCHFHWAFSPLTVDSVDITKMHPLGWVAHPCGARRIRPRSSRCSPGLQQKHSTRQTSSNHVDHEYPNILYNIYLNNLKPTVTTFKYTDFKIYEHVF